MSKEEPYRDQAERLRQRIEKIHEMNVEDPGLPPRSELHRYKKMKTKWKFKYPLIRILVLFFILLPITIFSIYSYLDSKKVNNTEKGAVSTKGYEPIKFENSTKNQNENTNNNGSNVNNTAQPNESLDEAVTNSDNDSRVIEGENNSDQSVATQSSVSNDGQPNGQDTEKNGNVQPSANTSPSDSTNNQADTQKMVLHTVQPHETLYRIAMKYYHSKTGIDTIKAANHLKSNNIETGQVLKIPLNK